MHANNPQNLSFLSNQSSAAEKSICVCLTCLFSMTVWFVPECVYLGLGRGGENQTLSSFLTKQPTPPILSNHPYSSPSSPPHPQPASLTEERGRKKHIWESMWVSACVALVQATVSFSHVEGERINQNELSVTNERFWDGIPDSEGYTVAICLGWHRDRESTVPTISTVPAIYLTVPTPLLHILIPCLAVVTCLYFC